MKQPDEICALLGYNAVQSGNFVPTCGKTYRSHFQGSRSLTRNKFNEPKDSFVNTQLALRYEKYGERDLVNAEMHST
jgi:hypothetical protein